MRTALVSQRDDLHRYLVEVDRHPVLTRDEEIRLARALRDEHDVAAAHTLVVSNLRFVVKIANEYRGYGLRLLDLIQEGNIGLMKAVKKFDPERGYRLISYAVFWIRAQIHEYIMRSWSLVKLGSGRVSRKLFFKLRQARAWVEQHGDASEPGSTAERMAEKLDVRVDDVNEMEQRLAAHDFSLDSPLTSETRTAHLDAFPGSGPDPEEQVSAQEGERLLAGVISDTSDRLDERERFVLENRLLADEPASLAEVGRRFGFSRERARQIEGEVINKLRQSATAARMMAANAG